MTTGALLARSVAGLTTLTLALASCDAPSGAPLAPERAAAASPAAMDYGPHVNQWVAGLRQLTTQWRTTDAAAAAGWDTPITGCLEMAGMGGMGFHYANPDLIDGTAEEDAPELLVFAPQPNGRLSLVAVEYIIPFTDVPANAAPPTLHGIAFQQNFTFNLWGLHVWLWQHNPDGIFAAWNPTVSCSS